jgi:hypothetical protein
MHTKAHSMKWFALLGLVLFLGVAVAPNMNAGIAKTFDSEVNNNQIHYGTISREKMIEIAEAYASFEWYPTQDNIAPRTNFYSFFHSVIARLVQNHTIMFILAAVIGVKFVDTPDRDTYTDWPDSKGWKVDEVNIGVPYQWGGFSSISGFNLTIPEDFYDQYTGTGSFEGKIHYAGDIFCDTQIDSRRSCGVDCSGFVSRCWNLPFKQSTRSLGDPKFSLPITFDDLQMGDILNRNGSHVMLFHEFIDENKTQLWVYEAGPDCKVGSWQYDIINISEDRHSIELNSSGIYELYSYNAGNLV